MLAPASKRSVTWTALSVLVVLAGLASIDVCRIEVRPHLLDLDEQSYLSVAEEMVRADRIPRVGMRPPLYPAILATLLAMDRDSAMTNLVRVQMLAWVACVLCVFLTTAVLTRRPMVGLVGSSLFLTMPEPLGLVRLIYAEAVASALALLSLLLLSVATQSQRRTRWLLLAALAAVGAAYARPIFQVLLPISLLVVAIDASRSWTDRVRDCAPFLVVGLLTLGPFYVYNGLHNGGFYFVKMGHLGLVNYLGDRRLIGNYPRDLQHVEATYRDFFEANPEAKYAPWWEMLPRWQRSHEANGGVVVPPSQFGVLAGGHALRVLLRNPSTYALRWWETWAEFSSSTTDPGYPAVCPAELGSGAWGEVWPLFGRWLPLAIFVGQLLLWSRRDHASAIELAPISMYLLIAILNTAIEPWEGQVRYRAPLQGFLAIALCVGGSSAWDGLRPLRRHLLGSRTAPDGHTKAGSK